MFFGGLRRAIVSALRVRPRGGIRRDTLRLMHLSGQLQMEWQARGVHPWDDRLAPAHQEELLVEQMLDDTERAMTRVFEALPEIDAISIRVLAPGERERILLAGTTRRTDLAGASGCRSPRMRLAMLGLRCGLTSTALQRDDGAFEPAGGVEA